MLEIGFTLRPQVHDDVEQNATDAVRLASATLRSIPNDAGLHNNRFQTMRFKFLLAEIAARTCVSHDSLLSAVGCRLLNGHSTVSQVGGQASITY